jgi:uncharacterized damage-inducible protein DinB
MKRYTLAALGLVLAAGGARVAVSQAAPAGERGVMLGQFDDAANKLVQLAQAIPQEKYTWRPGTGVRSVSEVLNHVTGGNYYVASFAGVQRPAGASVPADSVTDKARIVAALQASIAHIRTSLRNASDADLDKPATMFGQATTIRNVWATVVTHAHEHLGQMIAYARSNNVTPPWSMGQ